MYDRYVYTSHKKLSQDIKYPQKIVLPKSTEALLNHDFSPGQEIVIKKPITREVRFKDGSDERVEQVPIWFASTYGGVLLPFGFLNGDSRYLSDVMLDSNDVHGIFGGATGQGKSAMLNHLIMSMCDMYPPWELNLTLCDPKIVEFKNYALNVQLPHIKSVAATTDSSYIVSILESMYKRMEKMNSVFAKVGAANIEDFRKITGLTIPYNILILDECQTLVNSAGKELAYILYLIECFARLGRNTGDRLILASQEVASEMKPLMGNIKVRGTLGATAETSNLLIGNDEAKNNLGKKGSLIVNTETALDNCKEHNKQFKVPFISRDVILSTGKQLIEKASECNYKYWMNFYDEEDVVREKDYLDFVKNVGHSCEEIVLGMPSFVSDDKVFRVHMSKDNTNNILVDMNNKLSALRIFSILKYNFLGCKDKVVHNALCIESIYEESGKVSELCGETNLYTTKSYEDNLFFNVVEQTIYKRLLMLEVDNLVFKEKNTSEVSDSYVSDCFGTSSEYYSVLNRSRAFHICSAIQNDKRFNQIFAGKDLATSQRKYVEILLKMYNMYGSLESKVTYNTFPRIYNWILGLDKIIGIGRASKTTHVNNLIKLLQDCSAVKVNFIIFTSTLGDFASIRDGIQYVILDNPTTQELSKVKVDNYPVSVSKVLAVLVDKEPQGDRNIFKFKKMFFDDEQ